MDPFTMMAVGSAGASLISGFMGANSEKKAAAARQRGIEQGQAAFNAQADRAEGFVNSGTDRGLEYVKPYAEGGRRGYDLYLDAIGVNGRDKQAAYHSGFQDDPGFQAALDAGAKQVEHANIFRGRGDSGAAMKELYQFGERERLGAFRDRLDRLSSLSSMGLQAGNAAGGMEVGRGGALADIALKRGQTARDSAMGIGGAQAGGITGAANQYMGMVKGLGSAAMIGSGSLDGGAALSRIYGTASMYAPKSGGTTTLLK